MRASASATARSLKRGSVIRDSTTPSAPFKGTDLFIDGAATPPWEGGEFTELETATNSNWDTAYRLPEAREAHPLFQGAGESESEAMLGRWGVDSQRIQALRRASE